MLAVVRSPQLQGGHREIGIDNTVAGREGGREGERGRETFVKSFAWTSPKHIHVHRLCFHFDKRDAPPIKVIIRGCNYLAKHPCEMINGNNRCVTKMEPEQTSPSIKFLSLVHSWALRRKQERGLPFIVSGPPLPSPFRSNRNEKVHRANALSQTAMGLCRQVTHDRKLGKIVPLYRHLSSRQRPITKTDVQKQFHVNLILACGS